MTKESDALMQERLNSLLNNSQSKAAYSFGKAIRFKESNKKDYSSFFYDQPEYKNPRGTTLGYGKKCDYDKLVGCGSNQFYLSPTYTDPKFKNAPLYSFGMGRPKKKRYDDSPGPKYNCANCSYIVPSYIFGKSEKTGTKKIHRYSSMPGPGSYYNEKNQLLSQSATSNFTNSAKIIIGNAKRFPNNKQDRTPGPGEYEIPGLINKSGFIYNSKYSSIPAKSILGSRSRSCKYIKDSSPGPGAYNSFSIFEGYTKEKK